MSAPIIVMIYAQADEPWSKWIAHCLTTEKAYEVYRIWEPPTASNEVIELERAIEDATHIVILFSPDFFATQEILPGWSVAVKREQQGPTGIVVPIRIKDCNPRGLLESLVPINLTNIQEEEEARSKLLADFDGIHARAYGATRFSLLLQKPPFPPHRRTPIPETLSPQATIPSPRFPSKPFSNIPYARNPLFTEREKLFRQIAHVFNTHKPGSPPVVVLCGLHGSGKTQVALEYAYHHYDTRLYQYILWIDASSPSKLEEEVGKLVEELSLSEEKGSLPQNVRKDSLALKHWLRTHERWLLVFDHLHNVLVIDGYIPPIGNGHVILTTCSQHPRNAYPIHVGDMEEDEAISFLLLRARSSSLRSQPSSEELSREEQKYARDIVQLLHRFPLALDQAGGYIASTSCGLKRYWERAKEQPIVYLKKRGVDDETPDYYHPTSIVNDWKKAFHELEMRNYFAAELLLFCAFIHPNTIQEEVFIESRTLFWPPEQQADDDDEDKSSLYNIIIELKRYSFTSGTSEDRLLIIHPLMQPILLDILSSDVEKLRLERIIRLMKHACIDRQKKLEDESVQQWLPIIRVCLKLMDKLGLGIPEKQQLLELEQQMLDRLHDLNE